MVLSLVNLIIDKLISNLDNNKIFWLDFSRDNIRTYFPNLPEDIYDIIRQYLIDYISNRIVSASNYNLLRISNRFAGLQFCT